MVKQCEGETIPVTCAKAFGDIKSDLAAIRATAECIHEQVVRMNGHVGNLFDIGHGHAARIQALEKTGTADEKSRGKWGTRLWQAAVGAALLVLGYWLKS